MDIADPRLRQSRTEAMLPNLVTPYTETEDPKRAKLLTLKELPSNKVSNTDKLLPILPIPYKLKAEPRRR
jgi:hypothetical protein